MSEFSAAGTWSLERNAENGISQSVHAKWEMCVKTTPDIISHDGGSLPRLLVRKAALRPETVHYPDAAVPGEEGGGL